MAIARNAIVDHHRRRRWEDMPDEALEVLEEHDSHDSHGRATVLACVGPLMAELSPDAQRVMQWADLEGRSMQSIAGELSLSLSGAKSRVQRAHQELLGNLLRCCLVERDARGRAHDLEPRSSGSCARCPALPTQPGRYVP